MKHISMQIIVEVPDNYNFENDFKLMNYADLWDYDYQIIWTKEEE